MKNLSFNFGHPFTGHACLRQVKAGSRQCHVIQVDSKLNNEFEIPLHNCKAGKWSLELNWEYDGQSFTHQEEFDVMN